MPPLIATAAASPASSGDDSAGSKTSAAGSKSSAGGASSPAAAAAGSGGSGGSSASGSLHTAQSLLSAGVGIAPVSYGGASTDDVAGGPTYDPLKPPPFRHPNPLKARLLLYGAKMKEMKTFKWQRAVIRFPQEVTVALDGRTLQLTGKAGSVNLDLTTLDPTGLLAFKFVHVPQPPAAGGGSGGSSAAAGAAAARKGAEALSADAAAASSMAAAAATAGDRCLLMLLSPDREKTAAVEAEVAKAVRGVMQGYLIGMTVKGIGYRMEPVEFVPNGITRWFFEKPNTEKSTANYPHPKPLPAVRLKVGYTCTAVFPLPPTVRAFLLKPTLMYLYGLRLDELQAVAASIRAIRKPNAYTGNGISLLGETIKLKARSGSR